MWLKKLSFKYFFMDRNECVSAFREHDVGECRESVPVGYYEISSFEMWSNEVIYVFETIFDEESLKSFVALDR